jgi:hypothetical protein
MAGYEKEVLYAQHVGFLSDKAYNSGKSINFDNLL